MTTIRAIRTVIVFVAACGGTRDNTVVDSAVAARRSVIARECRVGAREGRGALTWEGIGALRVGATVAEVRAECSIVDDTILPGPEGTQERRITVAIGGDSVEAVVDGERVWRIEVSTPRFRTRDSLGVGTRGWELKRGRGQIATGEGNVAVVRDDHCGLSFFVSRVRALETWSTLPDSALVYRVLVYGCSTAPSPD